MCTYNGERYLVPQLNSIAEQERPPDELIICDDVSEDDSLSLLEAFAARAPFPVSIHRNPKNLGSTLNFDQVIRLAKGDVIVTADQDDVWFPEKLARMEAVLESTDSVGLVFSDAELIGSEGQQLNRRLWPSVRLSKKRLTKITRGDAFPVLLRQPGVTGAAMAFRTKFRDLILPIPGDWHHDEWIALLISAIARLEPISEPLMSYRLHGKNHVGVDIKTFRERSRRSIGTPKSYFRSVAERSMKLQDRLLENLSARSDLVALVESKISHFNARSELPKSRLRRLPAVVRELISLGYTRYSGSTLVCFADLAAES